MTESNGQLTKEIFPPDDQQVSGSIGLFNFLFSVGDLLPPWWSQSRDIALRHFAKDEDHLSGTIETLREMMVAIPFRVLPRDTTIKAHHALAQAYQDLFMYNFISRSNPMSSSYGDGLGPFLEDAWTQDNGAFLVVEGPGLPNGPVVGMPTKLIHLDSARCWRTGSAEFPVLFQDEDGAQYKIHRTRLLNFTFGSSGMASMYGVGFCSVSRAVYATQILKDVAHYKQEKLGSRQRRGIIVGDGIPTEAIESALAIADEALDNAGLTRFGRFPIIGSRKQGISLNLVDLVSLPDGFNNVEEYQLSMHVLALAFGVDVRQLAWAMGVAGQTKADALIQHIKQQGKGPGYVITELTRKIQSKILPDTLKIEFDRQDDEQDRAEAEIENIRSQVRERDVKNGIITIRVALQQMVEKGSLDIQQFEELELSNGRLPDGRPVVSLFNNPAYLNLLDLGVADPLDVFFNDPVEMILEIQSAKLDLNELLDRGGSSSQMTKIRQSLAALDALEEDYQAQIAEQVVEQEASTEQSEVNEEIEE